MSHVKTSNKQFSLDHFSLRAADDGLFVGGKKIGKKTKPVLKNP